MAYRIDQQGGKGNAGFVEGKAPTLLSDSHGTPHGVAYGISHDTLAGGPNAHGSMRLEKETAYTMIASGEGGGAD